MKIISKLKDYYDHEVAHFGRDESRVYDRRNSPKNGMDITLIHRLQIFDGSNDFYICGKVVPFFKKKGKIYFFKHDDLNDWENAHLPTEKWAREPYNDRNQLNQKYGQPVLYMEKSFDGSEKVAIPRLEDFAFFALYSSREMYQMIYDYLGWLKDNPPIPNTQTSDEKIVAHGFDVKTSFRPKMKK